MPSRSRGEGICARTTRAPEPRRKRYQRGTKEEVSGRKYISSQLYDTIVPGYVQAHPISIKNGYYGIGFVAYILFTNREFFIQGDR